MHVATSRLGTYAYSIASQYQASLNPPAGSDWAKVLAAWNAAGQPYSVPLNIPFFNIGNWNGTLWVPIVQAMESMPGGDRAPVSAGDLLANHGENGYAGPVALAAIATVDSTGKTFIHFSPDSNGNMVKTMGTTEMNGFAEFVIAVMVVATAAIGGAAIAGAGAGATGGTVEAGIGTGASAPVEGSLPGLTSAEDIANLIPDVGTLPTVPALPADLTVPSVLDSAPAFDVTPLQVDIPQIDLPLEDQINLATSVPSVPDLPQIDLPPQDQAALDASTGSSVVQNLNTAKQIASAASTIGKLIGKITGTSSGGGSGGGSGAYDNGGYVTQTSSGSIVGIGVIALAAYFLING